MDRRTRAQRRRLAADVQRARRPGARTRPRRTCGSDPARARPGCSRRTASPRRNRARASRGAGNADPAVASPSSPSSAATTAWVAPFAGSGSRTSTESSSRLVGLVDLPASSRVRATRRVPARASLRSPPIVATPAAGEDVEHLVVGLVRARLRRLRRSGAAAARTPRSLVRRRRASNLPVARPSASGPNYPLPVPKEVRVGIRTGPGDITRRNHSMVTRVGLVALVGALAVVAAGCGSSSKSGTTTAASGGGACSSTVSLGMLAPITGPAGSIGSDQLHWAQFFITNWNADSANSPKLKLVQGDTQLDPAKASTVAQSFASNKAIVGVIGPAGSDEVEAIDADLRQGRPRHRVRLGHPRLAHGRQVEGLLLPRRAERRRAGPDRRRLHDVEARVEDGRHGHGRGRPGVVLDRASPTSSARSSKDKGVTVDRESISQKSTDFSSLIAKVSASTKVVFLPFQLASQAQLFAQQLKAQGKTAVVFGSDGTFDSSKFNAERELHLVLRSGRDDARRGRRTRSRRSTSSSRAARARSAHRTTCSPRRTPRRSRRSARTGTIRPATTCVRNWRRST